MTMNDIQNTIKSLIIDLVNENYEKVYNDDYNKLGSLEELKEAVEDYPGHITPLPDSAFDLMRVYKRSEDEYDIDCVLWYNNQRSDYTLVCNIKVINGRTRYHIRDLLVR